jgi:hypothetical protein
MTTARWVAFVPGVLLLALPTAALSQVEAAGTPQPGAAASWQATVPQAAPQVSPLAVPARAQPTGAASAPPAPPVAQWPYGYPPPQPTGAASAPPAPPVAQWPYGYPPPLYANPTPGYVFAPIDDRPDVLDYDPSRPIPPGYVLKKRQRKGLLISGAVTLGLGYVFSVLWAELVRQNVDGEEHSIDVGWLYVPVLGPWLAMPSAHNHCSDVSCKDDRKKALEGLALVGTVQLVGAVLVTIGYTVPSKRLERSGYALMPVPMGRDGYGLAMSGPL